MDLRGKKENIPMVSEIWILRYERRSSYNRNLKYDPLSVEKVF